MKRREPEQTLRAAGRVAREVEFFLIGSQAVLGVQASQLAETGKGTMEKTAWAGWLRQRTAAVGVRTVLHGGRLSNDPSDAGV